MHTRKTDNRPAIFAGLLACARLATAAVQTFPSPAPSGFVDTESSTNLSLAAWRVYTPPVKLTLELDATPTNAVHVAFGRDLNGDADLQPEETEYVVGYDCGEWFERVENVERVESVERVERGGETSNLEPQTSNSQRVEHTFGFKLAKDPDKRWDLAKVTTRGKGDSAAAVTAELVKPFYYIVIR